MRRTLVLFPEVFESHINHALVGNFKGRWECHIASDWLLIYQRTENELVLERTGSHSDLFKK